MYIYIYVLYIYIHNVCNVDLEVVAVAEGLADDQRREFRRADEPHTANLRAKILDFGGFDSSGVLNSRGGILMSIGKEFPGNYESTNPSRDDLSRKIGCILIPLCESTVIASVHRPPKGDLEGGIRKGRRLGARPHAASG